MRCTSSKGVGLPFRRACLLQGSSWKKCQGGARSGVVQGHQVAATVAAGGGVAARASQSWLHIQRCRCRGAPPRVQGGQFDRAVERGHANSSKTVKSDVLSPPGGEVVLNHGKGEPAVGSCGGLPCRRSMPALSKAGTPRLRVFARHRRSRPQLCRKPAHNASHSICQEYTQHNNFFDLHRMSF